MKQAYVALHNAYEGRLKTGEMLRAMTALRHAIYEVDAISPTPIEDWPRQWQGLTDDDIAQAMYRADAIITGPMQFKFAREIEAKLKEKNHE